MSEEPALSVGGTSGPIFKNWTTSAIAGSVLFAE
jgi:hypothetical protein